MKSEWIWPAITGIVIGAVLFAGLRLWVLTAPAEMPDTGWAYARMADKGWPQAPETLCRARPEPLERAVPDYPLLAAWVGHEGWAIIAYDITAEGRTEQVTVLGSEPIPVFGHAASAAVAKWRFEPPGEPVIGCITSLVFEM